MVTWQSQFFRSMGYQILQGMGLCSRTEGAQEPRYNSTLSLHKRNCALNIENDELVMGDWLYWYVFLFWENQRRNISWLQICFTPCWDHKTGFKMRIILSLSTARYRQVEYMTQCYWPLKESRWQWKTEWFYPAVAVIAGFVAVPRHSRKIPLEKNWLDIWTR